MAGYTLGGYSESSIQPSSALQLSNASAAWDAASRQLRATFTLVLPTGVAAAVQPVPVIWAGVSTDAEKP